MLYFVLRPVLRLALQIYFRKICVHGLEHVPLSGPLILASNHPSAFFEGCLLACLQPRSVYFMVRGDVFVNPFYRRFLVALHQIPIYRFVDGFSNLRQNQSIMTEVYSVLAENKVILIFSEGRTIFEKKLQPLQKGTARMAFGAMQFAGMDDIPIVPVGINYTCFNVFRSEVMINFGAPISAKSYYSDPNTNQSIGVAALTNHLEQKLRSLTVNISRTSDEPLFNRLAATQRLPKFKSSWPVMLLNQESFLHEVNLAEKLNQGESPQHDTTPMTISKWRKIPYLIISILWILPWFWATRIADRRVTSAPFYGPVRFAIATFLTLIYLLIILLITSFLWSWWGPLSLIIASLLSYLALLLQDAPWHPDLKPDKYPPGHH